MFQATIRECHARAVAVARSIKDHDKEPDNDNDNDNANANAPDEPVPPPNFDEPNEEASLPYIRLSPPMQLPEKLLRGPWSAATLSFLHYLIWHGLGIDWQLSSRGEVATQGLQAAMAVETRNRAAAAALLTPHVGVVPSASLLKSAVMDHGCDQTVVFYMLNAALRAHIEGRERGQAMTDVNFRDSSLWRWADRAKKAGNAKGEWLLGALRFATDAAVGNSTYDVAVYDDLVRACGRQVDEVRLVGLPSQSSTSNNRA